MPIALICLMLMYAGLDAFSWPQHKKHSNKSYPLRTELLILDGALLVHGVALVFPVLQDKVLIIGFGYSLSLMVRLMLMIYYLGSFFYYLRGMQLLLYPCTALTLLLGFLFPGGLTGRQIVDLLPLLHIALSLLAYGLFGIVTLFATLILLINRDLHKRRLSVLVSFLPPLLGLGKPMFRGIQAGFILLACSVISGTFFAEAVFGKSMTFTHEAIFNIMSWLVYGALLLEHSMTVQRGKKTAVWTIVEFISLIFAYIDSKFVLEIILHRIGQIEIIRKGRLRCSFRRFQC